jgi:hypothetical protein
LNLFSANAEIIVDVLHGMCLSMVISKQADRPQGIDQMKTRKPIRKTRKPITLFGDTLDVIADNPEIIGVLCFLAPLLGVAVAVWSGA